MTVKSFRLLAGALAVAFLGSLGAPARASSNFVFDQSSYDVPVGGTVTIPVYLQLTGAEVTTLINGNGLYSAGVRITQDGAGPSSPSFFASASAVSANPAIFDDSLSWKDFVSSANLGLDAFLPVSASVGAPGTGDATTRTFLIGNFTFTGGSILGQTTSFLAGDFRPPTFSDTVTFGTDPNTGHFTLDPTTTTGIRITTIAPVPLPAAAFSGGILLLSLAGATGLRRRLCTFRT